MSNAPEGCNANVSCLYLLQGYYGLPPIKKNGASQDEIAEGESVKLISRIEPMGGQLVLVQPANTSAKAGDPKKPLVLISSTDGILYHCKKNTFEPECVYHYHNSPNQTHTIIPLPTTLVGMMADAKASQWQEELAEAIKLFTPDDKTKPDHQLTEQTVYIDYKTPDGAFRKTACLRPPITRNDRSVADDRYAEWYNTLKANGKEYITGCIMPRTRILALAIASEIPVDENAEIFIHPPHGLPLLKAQ